MLIELEKYSKLESENIPKIHITRHRDNRNAYINYGFGGTLLAIVLISLQICYTNVEPNQFRLSLY